MRWKLFLDDERFPSDAYPNPGDDLIQWTICRNVHDAKWYIMTYGMPIFMSLDHDLGANKFTGMDFCKWLTDYMMDNHIHFYMTRTTFHVHSMNPVGKANMEGLLNNWVEMFE